MITPIGSKIVIERANAEAKTVSGILLPNMEKQKQCFGTVKKIGSGRFLEDGTRLPIAVKEGDTVIFERYAGTTIEYDGVEYFLVDESDIIATVD